MIVHPYSTYMLVDLIDKNSPCDLFFFYFWTSRRVQKFLGFFAQPIFITTRFGLTGHYCLSSHTLRDIICYHLEHSGLSFQELGDQDALRPCFWRSHLWYDQSSPAHRGVAHESLCTPCTAADFLCRRGKGHHCLIHWPGSSPYM